MTFPETRYKNEPWLTALLTCDYLDTNERSRLNDDGFTTMELLVELFTYDVKGFKYHLYQVNTTFGASSDPGIRRYYTPAVISRL